jgi:predicted transcriptional regulator
MTLTLTPQTEANLLAWAEYEGQEADIVADVLLADALARARAAEVEAIRVGMEACDAGRVRPYSEFAAEMRAKYNLPTHLSDEEVFAGEEGIHGK